jgi:molybdopterin synthase catalytic subunit
MSEQHAAVGVLRLLDIRDEPLSVDEVLAAVADPAAGGTTLFVGTVRDHDSDREVTELGYEAHPEALTRLREVAERVAADPTVIALAAVHRSGDLKVGDLAVVVAVAAAHRDAAFAASRMLIDELKADVPIWKHQRFADGTSEWVGSS